MAKAIITISDNPDGTVTCNLTFKPAVKKDQPGTPAQHAAVDMITMAKAASSRGKRKKP
jgi:hypothetical protein